MQKNHFVIICFDLFITFHKKRPMSSQNKGLHVFG